MEPNPNSAPCLDETRNLARNFRRHLPEGELPVFDEVLPRAGPFIRTLTSNPANVGQQGCRPGGREKEGGHGPGVEEEEAAEQENCILILRLQLLPYPRPAVVEQGVSHEKTPQRRFL